MSDAIANMLDMVVIQFGSRTLKGYLEPPVWNSTEDLANGAPATLPATLRIRHMDSERSEEISTAEIKAIFYVNSHQGNSEHQSLSFHSKAPVAKGIWIRLTFRDGEEMEGLVYNSLSYLVDPGFFIWPTDPESNNKLAYVLKDWLIGHQVLGIRPFRQNL
jgi:hypothetical protein